MTDRPPLPNSWSSLGRPPGPRAAPAAAADPAELARAVEAVAAQLRAEGRPLRGRLARTQRRRARSVWDGLWNDGET
jgi:hypothetical protein